MSGATAANLGAPTATDPQPLESEVLRPQFREALRPPGFPQILLHFGYSPESKPTPRRDVRDVLL